MKLLVRVDRIRSDTDQLTEALHKNPFRCNSLGVDEAWAFTVAKR